MKRYDIEEDGNIYEVTEFDDGMTTKVYKGRAYHPVDEDTQRQLEMAANIEYAVELLEMQMEV